MTALLASAVAGALIALLILALGPSLAAWLTLAAAAIALVVGAAVFVRKDTRP